METTGNIADASSSKMLKCSDEDQDRISRLPDSVLVHILSLLPTSDAVKTVLVPRFRQLWTSIDTLSFSECLYHDCSDKYYDDGPVYEDKFLNFVHHVLILHESMTIYKFHLKIKFSLDNSVGEETRDDPEFQDYVSRERRMANEIDTWVRFAVRKKVKVLDLDFLGCGFSKPHASYRLPNVVFTSENLTELKLAACDIKPRGEIRLRSLKTLSLQEIMLREKVMDEILYGCPMLEELSLIECYGMRKLNFTCPNIKSLMLILGKDDLILEISCPNLISLEIAGSIEYAKLINVSSLVDASCYFSHRFKCARKGYREVSRLLARLSHAKTFTPCTWCIMVFTIWKLTNLPCPCFVWKHLVLKISLTKWHLPGISSLLMNSPCLETLTMYIYPGWCDIFTNKEAQWIQVHDFNGENYLNSQQATFNCLRHHLKTVMIFGYITEPCVIELIEFLLKNAMVLEKMVISTKKTLQPTQQYYIFSASVDRQKEHFTSEKLLEFSQKLLSLPRASTRAVIHFS